MSKIIRTSDLKIADVPPINAKWSKIAEFALSYDPIEIGDYGEKAGNLENASPESSINELRAHLYVEQRRWHHFGMEPDYATLNKLRKVLALLRDKLPG